jgi:hypothetical protein
MRRDEDMTKRSFVTKPKRLTIYVGCMIVSLIFLSVKRRGASSEREKNLDETRLHGPMSQWRQELRKERSIQGGREESWYVC